MNTVVKPKSFYGKEELKQTLSKILNSKVFDGAYDGCNDLHMRIDTNSICIDFFEEHMDLNCSLEIFVDEEGIAELRSTLMEIYGNKEAMHVYNDNAERYYPEVVIVKDVSKFFTTATLFFFYTATQMEDGTLRDRFCFLNDDDDGEEYILNHHVTLTE
jgi:hypothetical protein